MLQPRADTLTDIQKAFLQVLVVDYGNDLTSVMLKDVAVQVGCSPEEISSMLNGKYPAFNKERLRLVNTMTPYKTSAERVTMLAKIFDNLIDYRQTNQMPLSNKDPIEVLAEIRKEAIASSGGGVTNNTAVFNFAELSGKELSDRITWVQELLRSGELKPNEDIIDGEFAAIDGERSEGGTGRNEGGATLSLTGTGGEETAQR